MKKIRTKSVLSLLVILTMVLSSFSMTVSAAAVLSGLTAGGVYPIDDFKFVVTDAETVSVKIDGSTVGTTYKSDVVAVDTTDVTSLGAHKVTVAADSATVFDGVVNLEKTAAAVDTTMTLSSTKLGDATDDSSNKVTYVNGDTTLTATFPKAFSTSTKPYFNVTPGSAGQGIYELSYDIQASAANITTYLQAYHKSGDMTSASLVSNSGDIIIRTTDTVHLRYVYNTVSRTLEKYQTIGDNEETLIGTAALSENTYYPTFLRLRFFMNKAPSADVTVTISNVKTSERIFLPYVDSITADGEELTTDADGIYTVSPFASNITVNMTDAINASAVSFGSLTKDVTGSAISFADLALEGNSQYTLTIPASAKDANENSYGLARNISFKTTASDFRIASPENGKTYDISAPDLFVIEEGTATVKYALNGKEVAKENLATEVKLGENVLEVYADGSEYKYERVVFTTEKTYVYNRMLETFENTTSITDFSVHSWAKNSFTPTLETDGGKAGRGLKFANTSGAKSNVQLRASAKGANLGLRDVATDGYDNRFLSGRAVYSADVMAPDVSKLVIYSTFRGTLPYGRISNGEIIDDTSTPNKVLGSVENGIWFNIKYIFDFNLKECYFYIDDTLMVTTEITEDYPVADKNQLVYLRFEDSTYVSGFNFTIDNVDFHWEVPAEIEAVTYGNGTALGSNSVVPADTTAFNITTSLRIKDADITSDNIKFYANGAEVSGATVAKNTSDSSYLGQGTFMHSESHTGNYETSTLFAQEWYDGAKGTKIDVTIPTQSAGTYGQLVIKAGTSFIATDWKYTEGEDLLTLDKDLILPIYFGRDGIYAKTEKTDTGVSVCVLNEGEAEDLMLVTAQYTGNTLVSATPEIITAAKGAALTKGLKIPSGTSVFLWKAESLVPLTTKK